MRLNPVWKKFPEETWKDGLTYEFIRIFFKLWEEEMCVRVSVWGGEDLRVHTSFTSTHVFHAVGGGSVRVWVWMWGRVGGGG